MGAPCDHSREGRIRKALTNLSVLYSGALFRQQGRVPGSLCAPLACRSGSAVFWGYLLSSGKIEILLLKAIGQSLGLGRNFLCWCITADFIPACALFLHPCGERGLTPRFASSCYHQPALGVLSPVWGGGRAVPCCPQLLPHSPDGHTARWCAHHATSFFPLCKFTCYFLPIFLQNFQDKWIFRSPNL